MKKINLENKRVLIVGGAGFIGHNLALKLKELKADVNIIDGMTVNNLYSLENNTNQLPYPKLAMKIINERQKLLKKNEVPLIIQDARATLCYCPSGLKKPTVFGMNDNWPMEKNFD